MKTEWQRGFDAARWLRAVGTLEQLRVDGIEPSDGYTTWARFQQSLGWAVLACLRCGADTILADDCSVAELVALAVEWQQLHARCDGECPP